MYLQGLNNTIEALNNLNKALKDVNKILKSLDNALKGLNKALKGLSKSTLKPYPSWSWPSLALQKVAKPIEEARNLLKR